MNIVEAALSDLRAALDDGRTTAVALAAAFTASLPVWGFHGLGMGLNYLLTGLVVDALYRLLRGIVHPETEPVGRSAGAISERLATGVIALEACGKLGCLYFAESQGLAGVWEYGKIFG